MWHERGDRCLLFCQTRQMLDIVHAFVRNGGYTHCRLDGTTPVGRRLTLIDDFNEGARLTAAASNPPRAASSAS